MTTSLTPQQDLEVERTLVWLRLAVTDLINLRDGKRNVDLLRLFISDLDSAIIKWRDIRYSYLYRLWSDWPE